MTTQPGSTTERARVLVVDDDPIARAAVVAHLVELGHETLEASDGRAALDQLRSADIDVVLLAVEMPEFDGFDVLTALAESGPSGTAVVAVTGRDRDGDAARAFDLGAVDFIRKPVQRAALVARVGTALRVGRLERQLAACNDRLQEATRSDPLTGLANRTHVAEHLAMASSGARRHRQPVSIVLVDADHLKRVNDDLGHAAGDEVLRVVAARALRVLRGEDMAGRWGGDELLVVAPNTDLDGAWRLGERIREAISAVPIPLSTGRDVLVTVSVGCSSGHGDDVEAQLKRAEAALAEAKALGRNRVCSDQR